MMIKSLDEFPKKNKEVLDELDDVIYQNYGVVLPYTRLSRQ